MSYCDLINDANDINICGSELLIGELVDTATKVDVLLTNKATGRMQVVEGDVNAGLVSIRIPSDLSPGQVYEIKLRVNEHAVSWKPYEFIAGSYSISPETIDSASVLFVKIFSETPDQQWITLQ